MAIGKPMTVMEAVDHVAADHLLLPGIQRNFVWRPRQIAALFDSLLRGYPIGTLLLWKTKPMDHPQLRFRRLVTDYHGPSTTPNVALMAEQHHRPGPGWLETGQRGGVLGELDADDDAALPLAFDPGELGPVEPVDVRAARERVAMSQRHPVVVGVRYGHARADRVARPQQRAEVRTVRDPQRCDDEVIPAAVLSVPAGAAEVLRPGVRPGGHRAGGQLLEVTMCGALGGGA